jgi:hypothetical protein
MQKLGGDELMPTRPAEVEVEAVKIQDEIQEEKTEIGQN